jgi:hypothetical protein
VDASLLGVASFFPRGHFVRHQASIVQLTVEILATHDVDLRLRYVQATAVFRRVMKLDLV